MALSFFSSKSLSQFKTFKEKSDEESSWSNSDPDNQDNGIEEVVRRGNKTSNESDDNKSDMTVEYSSGYENVLPNCYITLNASPEIKSFSYVL